MNQKGQVATWALIGITVIGGLITTIYTNTQQNINEVKNRQDKDEQILQQLTTNETDIKVLLAKHDVQINELSQK